MERQSRRPLDRRRPTNTNRMHLYDAATNRLLRSYDAGSASRRRAGVDRSGRSAPTAASSPSSCKRARPPSRCACWTRTPCNPRRPGSPPRRRSRSPVVRRPCSAADGRYLAATFSRKNGQATRWSGTCAPRPRPPSGYRPAADGAQPMALSPDGQTLYTAWPLTAYDVATGKRIWREPSCRRHALDLNAEGTLLALADRKDLR